MKVSNDDGGSITLDNTDKMDELIKKMNRYNNSLKLILQLLKTIDEKTNEKKWFKENGEASEKKSIGRPVGDFETKRKQYLDMVNSKIIKQPKETTIQCYKIDYDEDTETYSW